MKLLVVGGAGHIGSIIQPVLAREHDYACFDRRAVESIADRCIVGDVRDGAAVDRAVAGVDAIVYLAMGLADDGSGSVQDIGPAFGVNAEGVYRLLQSGLAGGATRFVYASTLSVYRVLQGRPAVDEEVPPDEWGAYGMTKRLGEQLCAAAAQAHPHATIVALRLMRPLKEPEFSRQLRRKPYPGYCPIGPNDLCRLFSAALAFDRPGLHIIQATGDVAGTIFPHRRAMQLLGWSPQGN